MQSNAKSLEEYVDQLPAERQEPFELILDAVRAGIDPKFAETFDSGVGWVVPLELYPGGYHCTPAEPVPFLGLVSQKQYIALYHMGIYADPEAEQWFREAYAATGFKLDMGKSCIRFKKMDQIPYPLIKELAAKISLQSYLDTYASHDPRNR